MATVIKAGDDLQPPTYQKGDKIIFRDGLKDYLISLDNSFEGVSPYRLHILADVEAVWTLPVPIPPPTLWQRLRAKIGV